MVRSMYSGVAGMRAHQTRMDVIGNNIANVNTYGFKSSRATFRDVYYQATRGAAAASGTTGGINPSSVGYGATISSVDVLQTQSSLTNTGNPLDVAIMGEGFLQVQDNDGNIFYTKAGMLDIDSFGNVVDLNGNFVLGVSGNPLGQTPNTNRIQVIIPAVEPSQSKKTEIFNGVKYTVSSANASEGGNVTFNFVADSTLPIGQKCEAVLTNSGITIRVNTRETFSNVGEFNAEVNRAITKANGGTEHPGGDFTINMDPPTKFKDLTGAQIVGKNFGVEAGSVQVPSGMFGGFSYDSVGDHFSGLGEVKYELEHVPGADANSMDDDKFILKVTTAGDAGAGANTYTCVLTPKDLEASGSIVLRRYVGGSGAGVVEGESDDVITMNFPNMTSLMESAVKKSTAYVAGDIIPPGYAIGQKGPYVSATGQMFFGDGTEPETGTDPTVNEVKATKAAVASRQSKDLGISLKPIILGGGTQGGTQSVSDLSSISIGSDGVITGFHSVHGMLELGRIDLANFANTQGLQQSGNTYFTTSPNSGTAILGQPGTNGCGTLKSSSLEMSNVDLSNEFSDMITTQRGFQANSRLITVSDTMLEELINLKR